MLRSGPGSRASVFVPSLAFMLQQAGWKRSSATCKCTVGNANWNRFQENPQRLKLSAPWTGLDPRRFARQRASQSQSIKWASWASGSKRRRVKRLPPSQRVASTTLPGWTRTTARLGVSSRARDGQGRTIRSKPMAGLAALMPALFRDVFLPRHHAKGTHEGRAFIQEKPNH